MTRVAAILLCSIGAGSLFAQTTPAQKPGSIEGVVTNAVTGEPVKKAMVTAIKLSEQTAKEAVTDASGHFHFDKVEPGDYWFSAQRDGFTAEGRPGHSTPAIRQKVGEDEHITGVALKLTPLAVVSGHVLDEDGDPMILANVQALGYIYNQGRRQLQQMSSATVNDLGEFQMIDVQPGRYYFSVTAATRERLALPPHTRSSKPEETYPTTFYPNAFDVRQASAIEIGPGARLTNIDFHVAKARAYHVRGKVVDGATGQPAHNVGIQFQSAEGQTQLGMVSGAMPQPDGTFDVRRVVNGSYILFAQRREEDAMVFGQRKVDVADEDVGGVSLTLAPGIAVSGAVSIEGAQPGKLAGSVTLGLQSRRMQGPNAFSQIDDAGAFTLKNLVSDVYTLMVFSNVPGKYVKSIRFGDQEAPSGEIDLTSGVGGKLTIVFGADGGEIDGAVENSSGDPAANVLITAAPADGEGRLDLTKQTFTDLTGKFKVQDLAPGDYRVFAWQDVDQNMTQWFEFRKAFESYAASITVVASGKESIQLKAISAATVEEGKSKLP